MNSRQRAQKLAAHQLFRLRPRQFAAGPSTPPARSRRNHNGTRLPRIKPAPQRPRPLRLPASRWSTPAFLPEPAQPLPLVRSTFVNLATRFKSSTFSRHLISGFAASVPVPLHGTSASTQSNFSANSIAVTLPVHHLHVHRSQPALSALLRDVRAIPRQ